MALAAAATMAACGPSGHTPGAPTDTVARTPRLLNGQQVIEAIEAEYPPALRDQGIGGTVRLRLLVDTNGVPVEVRLLDRSGFPELDDAAARVGTVLRFDPAVDESGRPVRVWAAFPIVFSVF